MIDFKGDFDADVVALSQDRLVLAYCTTPWCGPCRMLKPRLESLENKFEGLTVVRIDLDTYSEVGRDFQIMSVPTLYFYSGGYRVADFTGIQTEKVLTEVIEKYL